MARCCFGGSLNFNESVIGAPGRIRTSDPLVRSQALYPTELRARCLYNDEYIEVPLFNKMAVQDNTTRLR